MLNNLFHIHWVNSIYYPVFFCLRGYRVVSTDAPGRGILDRCFVDVWLFFLMSLCCSYNHFHLLKYFAFIQKCIRHAVSIYFSQQVMSARYLYEWDNQAERKDNFIRIKKHKCLLWSTKNDHDFKFFSSIYFPIRLVVTCHFIREAWVHYNTQRYSPLWLELHRWSLRTPPLVTIRSLDSWRCVSLGCYPSSFPIGWYFALSCNTREVVDISVQYTDLLPGLINW